MGILVWLLIAIGAIVVIGFVIHLVKLVLLVGLIVAAVVASNWLTKSKSSGSDTPRLR